MMYSMSLPPNSIACYTTHQNKYYKKILNHAHVYLQERQKCENLHVKANDDESSLHDNTPMPQGVNKMDACMDLALPISVGLYKEN